MNEKQFILDLWDVMRGNTEYITQEEFNKKYEEIIVDLDTKDRTIRLMDNHNEWQLSLQKVWCDETNVKED